MEEPVESDRPDYGRPRWRQILDRIGLLQLMVLPLALLARWLPIVGGGAFDFAPEFMDAPTYLERVFVNLVALTLFVIALGIVPHVGAKVLEALGISARAHGVARHHGYRRWTRSNPLRSAAQ